MVGQKKSPVPVRDGGEEIDRCRRTVSRSEQRHVFGAAEVAVLAVVVCA